MQTNFILLAFGMPIAIVAVAVLGAIFSRGSDAELLDWKPTRSPETESKLEITDVEEMLAAQNRYRRERGAPERSLDDVIAHPWVGLESRRRTHDAR